MAAHQLAVQRACRGVRLSRAAYYRPPTVASRRDAAVIAVLTEVVARHGRWGFWQCYGRLRLEGHRWNHKRVHRVDCALHLNMPRRTVRRVARRLRQPLEAPAVLNQTWALDFVTDTLYDGRRIRALTIIDEGNREGMDIAVGISLPSRRVVRVLEDLVTIHGSPRPCASTMGRSFWRSRLSTGPRHTAWRSTTSSRASRIKMRSSSASIEATGPRCSTRTSSNHRRTSRRSPMPGSAPTTTSGLTTALAGSRRSRFCRGHHPRRSLRMHCLLDGEAYGRMRRLLCQAIGGLCRSPKPGPSKLR